MKKALSVAALLLLGTNAFAADDPDRVEAPKASSPRVELAVGTSAHDLRSVTGNGTYASTYSIPMMPTADLRVSFPSSFLASGVGLRATWVMPTLGDPSTARDGVFMLSTDGSTIVNGIVVPKLSELARYQRAVIFRNIVAAVLNGAGALAACGAAVLAFALT